MLTINDFDTLVSDANSILLHRAPSSITYSNPDELSKNETINDATIAQEVGDGANIYAIWSRASNSDQWEVMYIGQRSKGKVIERIKQHLFKTPNGTQSKLAKVKELVAINHQIGISTILITPDPLRLSVEDQLIFTNTNNDSDLPLNNKSRNVSLSRT